MRGSRWVLTEGENLGRWFPDDSPPARVLASPGSSLPPGLREIELCRLRRGRVQRLGIAGQFLLPPEQRRHPLHLRRLLRIGGEVAHFERVSSQIKELRPIDLRIPDQLPAVLADGALHVREGGQDRLTRRPDISRQPRGEAPALALLRRGQPGERAERRENIREIAQRRALPPRRDARPGEHQRGAHRVLAARPLGFKNAGRSDVLQGQMVGRTPAAEKDALAPLKGPQRRLRAVVPFARQEGGVTRLRKLLRPRCLSLELVIHTKKCAPAQQHRPRRHTPRRGGNPCITPA